MKKQVRSLKAGTMMVAHHQDSTRNERAVAFILVNDYASKYCTIHAFNYREQKLLKEWVKEYSYKEMREILKTCHAVY